MVSRDQTSELHFDRLAGIAALHAGRTIRPWVELRAGAHGGVFGADKEYVDKTGGLLAPTLGAAFQLAGYKLRPWIAIDIGPAITGRSARPFVSVTLGIDSRVERNINVGPVFGLGRVIQWNGPRYSTDASFMWLGLSMRFRFDHPPKPMPPREVRIIERTRTVERVVEQPPTPPDEDVLRMIEDAVPTLTQRTELLAPVLFKFNSDTLEPIGVAMLHEVASQLAQRPDLRVLEIQGYADARGSAEYNQALSQRRAERVQAWLIEHGVAPERLRVAARGASAPVEAGSEERAHEQNRRVIFRVVEQGEAP